MYYVEFDILSNTPEHLHKTHEQLFGLDRFYITFDLENLGEVATRIRYLFRVYQNAWYEINRYNRFFKIYTEIEGRTYLIDSLEKISEDQLILILNHNVVIKKIKIL